MRDDPTKRDDRREDRVTDSRPLTAHLPTADSTGAPDGAAAGPLAALAGRRVVFLNWRDLAHPQAGGAELYCQSLAERFAAAGADVALLTARPPGLPASAITCGVRISRGGGTFGVYPSVLARLARLARTGRGVDAVVDCQNGIPFFSPLVLPRHVPVVQVLHHVHQKQFPLYFPGPLARVGQLLETPGSRWVYRRRPVVVVSPSTRDEARSVLALPGPRYLVPNGVTTALSAPVAADGPAVAAAPTIVCVGRLVPHKRLHLLLDAVPALAARHPGLTVHLIGDGPDRDRLLAHAAALGIDQGDGASGATVRWHGYTPAATRDALLATAWLTVNPSHGEGWGLSVIEANALGVPAVAFRVPGLRDAVRDGETGWLVDRPERLVGTIDAALTELADPAAAARRRAAARRWAAGFTWDASAALLAAVLSAEIARAGRPDRRRRDEVSAWAEFTLPPGAPLPRLRRTDLCFPVAADPTGPGARLVTRAGHARAAAVLYGASPAAARAALGRAGVHTVSLVRQASDADLLLAACRGGAGRGEAAPDLARRSA